jgi:hypothetical protein
MRSRGGNRRCIQDSAGRSGRIVPRARDWKCTRLWEHVRRSWELSWHGVAYRGVRNSAKMLRQLRDGPVQLPGRFPTGSVEGCIEPSDCSATVTKKGQEEPMATVSPIMLLWFGVLAVSVAFDVGATAYLKVAGERLQGSGSCQLLCSASLPLPRPSSLTVTRSRSGRPLLRRLASGQSAFMPPTPSLVYWHSQTGLAGVPWLGS